MSEYRETFWINVLPKLKDSRQIQLAWESMVSSERLGRELGSAIYHALLESDYTVHVCRNNYEESR